jgi:Fic family protein
MAANYLEALAWVQKKGAGPVLEKDVLRLHALVGRDAVAEGPLGAYRRTEVRAGLHVGPPWRRVPALTRGLLAWLHGPAGELPAHFSAAVLHLRFAEIHPFRDGNGRMARLLTTWQLYRSGFDTLHVFALDEVLLENRALYIKALQRVQVEGADLGAWIEFMAEAVLETLERVEKRLLSLGPVAGKEPLSLTVRQEKLLQLLKERGALPIRDIARALRVTPPGAHHALKALLSRRIVVTQGSYKNTRYVLPG